MTHPDQLTKFANDVLRCCAVPDADAALVADSLVKADLWGHQSHGIMRLPWYVARLRSGVMRAITEPEFLVDIGALAVIDGHDGIGQVLAHVAAGEAIRRAKHHGIAIVGVRNSNHFGTAGYFTRMAPPQGCIALLTTNASPSMAPWGGRKKMVGNNPWSIAAPAGRYVPMVLDIANTVVARGKLHVARQRGVRIPVGWAINSNGQPTTDPVEALAGIVLPMAEHKGYAISVLIDVLSGVLTGSRFGTGVTGPYQAEKLSGCGHLIIAIDITGFMPLTQFNARVEQLIEELKSAPLADGFDEILYPGELESRNEERQRLAGLDLPAQTMAELAQLADEMGLPYPFPLNS